MTTALDIRHRDVPIVAVDHSPATATAGRRSRTDRLAAEQLVAAAHVAARDLPATVRSTLAGLADDLDGPGAVVLRGLDMGPLPATPASPTAPVVKDLRTETLLLAVATMLGEPVGYLPEHGGDIVQNILPTAGDADRQTSTSSRSTLGFHTETAFHPHRPRFLVLACLRGDAAAHTTLCCIDDVLVGLDPDERRVLAEPRFRTRADESFGGGPDGAPGDLAPVLSGDPAHPVLVLDAELTSGVDAEAAAALAHLVELVATHHTSVVLEAGDVLVVDNHRCVHGRSPFAARFDGTDRWLQRAFVVDDLAPSAGERTGRIVTTTFA